MAFLAWFSYRIGKLKGEVNWVNTDNKLKGDLMSKQLELEILEFLFFVQAIKRKEISMLFNDSVNLRSIQVSVKSLIDQKYAEQIKYKKANYLKITEAGISYIAKNIDTYSINQSKHIPFSVTRYSAYSVEMMTYMRRVGLPTLPTEKPSLPALITHLQVSVPCPVTGEISSCSI